MSHLWTITCFACEYSLGRFRARQHIYKRVRPHIWSMPHMKDYIEFWGRYCTYLSHVTHASHACMPHTQINDHLVFFGRGCGTAAACLYAHRDPSLHRPCDSFICVIWLVHMRETTHSCVWHDSFVSTSCGPSLQRPYGSFICVTSLIRKCDMTLSCVWHDSSVCTSCDPSLHRPCDAMYIRCIKGKEVFLFARCVYTQHAPSLHRFCDSVIWVMSHIWMSWLIHMCDMTHSFCDSVIWVMSHIWMSHDMHVWGHTCMDDLTQINETCHTYEWDVSHAWMSQSWHTCE